MSRLPVLVPRRYWQTVAGVDLGGGTGAFTRHALESFGGYRIRADLRDLLAEPRMGEQVDDGRSLRRRAEEVVISHSRWI
jgi:hypothetical protein